MKILTPRWNNNFLKQRRNRQNRQNQLPNHHYNSHHYQNKLKKSSRKGSSVTKSIHLKGIILLLCLYFILGRVYFHYNRLKGWVPPNPGRYSEYKDGTNIYTKQFTSTSRRNQSESRKREIRNAMNHAWAGYRTYAYGKDELLPQSGKGRNNWGGLSTTMIDSLDTLWLMGMKEEFWEARDWIAQHLNEYGDV